MKLRVKINDKERIFNVNFLDLLKIYIVIGIVATTIFLIFWIIILLLLGPLTPPYI